MTVEVVLMTPVLVAFLLLVVAFGRLVWVRGQVEAASRDAVRAATLERDAGSAAGSARDTAAAQLDGRADCGTPRLGGTFDAGGVITVTLRCRVSYDSLGLLGLPGSVDVESTSAAPLDVYRRTRVSTASEPRDSGAATIFVLGLAVMLLVLAGLVVDGGLAINARERVADDAEQAARAGAQQIDVGVLRSTGQVQLDPASARAAAVDFLIARSYSGATASATATQEDVTVTVGRRVDTALLSLIFIQDFPVRASAQARPAVGIAAEIP